jgi:hypothetical protein
MTDEDREARYRQYVESTTAYFEKIRADGEKPWFSSEEERRELFMRRYARPDSRDDLRLTTDLDLIRNGVRAAA